MGLNTRHDKTNDKYRGKNLTQESVFRFELLNGVEIKKLELTTGLSVGEIALGIKVNGASTIALNDRLELMGRIMKVISLNAVYDNPNQNKYRNDYDNFTGYTEIGLK